MHRLAHPLLLLTVACGTAARFPLPEGLDDVPGTANAFDRRCAQARQTLDAGDERAALAELDALLADAPEHVDALRVRQDVLRRRGRSGRCLWEAERLLAEHQDSAAAHYLYGRLLADDRDKLAHFEEAIRLAPRSLWGWLGAAYALRALAPERSLAIYRALYRASQAHPVVAVALAVALRSAGVVEGVTLELPGRPAQPVEANEVGKVGEALSVYERLRHDPRVPGLGDLGVAETLALLGRREAWPALLRALQLRPFDPGVRRLTQQLVTTGLTQEQLLQVIDALQPDAGKTAAFARDDGTAVLAGLLAAAGLPFAARAALEDEHGAGPRLPALRREWRRLLLRTGETARFLAELRADFPVGLLRDERNQLRGLWAALLEGPWMALADPLAEAAGAAALTEALLRAGLLEEAEMVASQAVLRHRGEAALTRLCAEARRELSFERAVRRVVYHGYGAKDGPPDLDKVLTEVRRIGRETLGQDPVGEPRRFSVPFVGELLDPLAPGLCAHFARYNRYLVLGQRQGGAVEGLLLVRLSLRELEDHADLPLPARTFEVIGEDRQIRSLSGVSGGDLAGVALLSHYVVDMDSVRDWAHELRERRRVVREDGGAQLRDPLPERVPALEPASVQWRLTALAPEADQALDDAVLDLVRWHERAHLVDAYHFLPVESNVLRVLGLVLRHGLSQASVEADFEARAEAAALALSPHTHLVLAHLAVFLEGEATDEPHGFGFRRLSRRLAERLQEAGRDPRASRWHLLEPGEARRIGLQILRAQW